MRIMTSSGPPETIAVLVTDFGRAIIPDEMRPAFAGIVLRRDGTPDRRYALGRKLGAWERRMNDLACARYVAGFDPCVVVEPFDPERESV